MIISLTILICLLGIIISIYDIKSKSIPIVFLGLHLLSIIVYISLYSSIIGIILGLSGMILFLICILKHFTIDWLYVLLICIGLILLKVVELLTPLMLIPIIICAIFLAVSKIEKFPYMTCLTSIISLILIQILFK